MDKRDVTEKHDQYCQYENLPKLLKRFSFCEKMRMANIYSSSAILFNKENLQDPHHLGLLPWCLETFVMLAMEAYEYSNGDFKGKNKERFRKIYNAIWNASPVLTKMPSGEFSVLDTFLAVTGLNQFHMQESPWIREYRYWQAFNDNSAPVFLKDIFIEKMGTEYEDFLLLGHILQALFFAQADNEHAAIPQKTLCYLLYIRFPEAAKHLTISRAEYIALQKRFAAGSDDPYKYVYSLRPSYQYAFVQEGKSIYFPLPHLLNQNITSSLLYRITDGDNKLREQIGKYIWEKYLLNLVQEAGVYQEVFPEQLYTYAGSESHSPDVLARQGEDVLFIDSKSTVPNIGIRLLDPDSYKQNIRIVAENIAKLYRQMHRFEKYNPFSGSVSYNKKSFWGIVVVLEDAYIRRINYFENAKDILIDEDGSAEWDWLIAHIKVISLYEIERICLSGYSLINACRESFGDDPFNFTFSEYPPNGAAITNEGYRTFRKICDEKVMYIVAEMAEDGVL